MYYRLVQASSENALAVQLYIRPIEVLSSGLTSSYVYLRRV